MEYTKGKWRVAYENKKAVVSEIDSKILTICTTTTGTGKYMTQDDAEANAKLIAAAPDLLEALTVLLEIVEKVHGNAIIGKPARMKAKQAILKATT